MGYLSVCQAENGLIHLISSINHNIFNLAWLEQENEPVYTELAARDLEERGRLHTLFQGNILPENASPSWNHFRDGMDVDMQITDPESLLQVRQTPGSELHWSNERIDEFSAINADHGLTVEFQLLLDSTGSADSGFEFEVFLRTGPLTVNHYRLLITSREIHYWYDNEYSEVATGLDNADAMHIYRLAIRDDSILQLYRDNRLLDVLRTDFIVDWRQPARGPISGGATRAMTL